MAQTEKARGGLFGGRYKPPFFSSPFFAFHNTVDKLGGGVGGCMFGVMSDWTAGCTIFSSFVPFFLLGLGWAFV